MNAGASEVGRGNTTDILPPNGHLVYASSVRHQITWLAFGWFALIDLVVAATALALGSFAGVALGVGCVVLAIWSLRIPTTGLVLEEHGIRLRTAFWTYKWHWDEVRRFELKPRGYIPRFRIHLTDGRIKKAGGFFARRPTEEERSQALVAALTDRLRAEQTV
jgi:hypothetical protein